ncbi:hypothetical protein ACJIZ3_007365 [Penstemon smallii]|uniref:Rapid ALkalinization Factor n=1 Tax=Penstemon smallii TaxID=265156 RepID=A0ABD3SAC6_9LAMI
MNYNYITASLISITLCMVVGSSQIIQKPKHINHAEILSSSSSPIINSNSKCDHNGLLGDCINTEEEMMMGSEISRRILAQSRYIGYGALERDNIPCNVRGSSYYNCRRGGGETANPYRRGCSKITYCERNNN